MKKDYLYKSPNGTRMFELGLDDFQLKILTPNHNLLNQLENKYGKNSGIPLVEQILEGQSVNSYKKYLGA